ncbi:MAG TPA: hypothetical protein DEO49_07215 [Sutterella sp.]|nr:hypothetical protein [Sutterella sp.]
MKKSEKTQQEIADLDDIRVMYEFCFMFFEHVSEQHVNVVSGKLSPEDAANDSTSLVAWFSAALDGKNPEVAVRSKSDPNQNDQRLREHFAKELAALPEEDARHFAMPGGATFFAVLMFLKDVMETLEELASHAEEKIEGDAREVHELCVEWAELFTNQKFPQVA